MDRRLRHHQRSLRSRGSRTAKSGWSGSPPGISRLFTAITRPPHLAAIAVVGDSDTGRGTLRPGGIFNNGFALDWASERNHEAQAAPASGQGWAGNRILHGDTVCAANQVMRAQAPDVLQMIEDHPYWDDLAVSLAPELFVGKINVPTFLAGAWQDEQTGPYFANLLDNFTGTDKVWFTVTNGAHTDSLDPAILDRWIEFLDPKPAQAVPKRPPIAAVAQCDADSQVRHTSVTLPPDRFARHATSLARHARRSRPTLAALVREQLEAAPGLPYAQRRERLQRWPVRVRGTPVVPLVQHARRRRDGPGRFRRAHLTPGAHVTTLAGTDQGQWLPLRPGTGPHPRQKTRLPTKRHTARDRHRHGRDGQRRSLDQDRRRRRRPATITSASGRQGGARAERLAARQLAGARTGARRRCGPCTRTPPPTSRT